MLILFSRENNQRTPRSAARQEERDQHQLGSPEQHQIPQRLVDRAPIPFSLPTASAGPSTLDPFVAYHPPPNPSPTVTAARNNLDALRAAAAASNVTLQQASNRGRGRGGGRR